MTRPLTQPLSTAFRDALRCACDGARLMVGQPNYEAYVAHVRRTHPDATPMDRTAFFRDREAARFGGAGRGGFRCC